RAAGRARLDLQAGCGRPDLVEQAVGRQGLAVHAGAAGAGGPGVDQVTVVVPLHVVDAVLAHQGQDLVPDVGERIGVRQVQDLLVAEVDGHPAGELQDPVRVRAGDVGVEVDHLGLEPQAELHAAALDRVDQRPEPALPPDGVRDHPV